MSKTASDFFSDSVVYQMSRLNWRVCSTSRIEYPIGPLNLSDTCYKNAMLRRKKSHWTKQKRKVPFQMIWARCPTAFLRSQHGVPRDRPAAAGSILSILFSYDVTYDKQLHH